MRISSVMRILFAATVTFAVLWMLSTTSFVDVEGHAGEAAAAAFESGEFNANDLSLNHSQCLVHFPNLFSQIEETASFCRKIGGIYAKTFDFLYSLNKDNKHQRGGFQIHIVLKNNKLFIKEYIHDHPNINRAMLLLEHLDRIIQASPEPISDAEFVIDITDQGAGDVVGPVFSLARKHGNQRGWLIPDFGFNAWPEVGVLSYETLRNEIEDFERRVRSGKTKKVDKLFWRGAPMHFKERKESLDLANEKWADIKELKWSCMSTPNKEECKGLTDHKTIPEHCGYKYLLQTEGYSYSGRFKYLLNCNSIVVAGKLDWDQHFHHLLDAKDGSPNQNIVQVAPPFKVNLPLVMESLMKNATQQKIIRKNSWSLLRNRYLTPAANACYWRHLINQYAALMQFEPSLELRELEAGKKRLGAAGTGLAPPYESFILMRKVDWELN